MKFLRFHRIAVFCAAVYAQDAFCVDASIINAYYANSNIMPPTGVPFSYMYKRPGGKITLVNTLTP